MIAPVGSILVASDGASSPLTGGVAFRGARQYDVVGIFGVDVRYMISRKINVMMRCFDPVWNI